MVKDKKYINQLLKKGYFIYDIENTSELNKLKDSIFHKSKKILNQKELKNSFFNNFHNLKKSKLTLNDFRLKLMKEINFKHNLSDRGFKIFHNIIGRIFGQDIATQKNVNLVIHQPGDTTQVTVHRDAPPNSEYEMVVWLPLVDTYKTKNMYILDKSKTAQLLKKVHKLSKKKTKKELIMDKYYSFAFKNADQKKIRFGQALLFWTALIHCVPVNKEKETRWSLNFRYKNTFSPYGTKGFPDYFKVVSSSPVTKLTLEKKEKSYT